MSMLKKIKLVNIFLWVVVLLWAVLIFTLSAQPAEQSNNLSSKVTKTIVETVIWIANINIDTKTTDGLVQQLNHLVRKSAHTGIYFVLGVLVIKTCIKTGVRDIKAYIFAMIFCIFYAATDEFHQTFVPGRSGQISDVLIDTAGAILGIGACWVYNKINFTYHH